MNMKNVTYITLAAAILLMAGCLWLGMSFCRTVLAWIIVLNAFPSAVIVARLQNNSFAGESESFFRRVFFAGAGACIASLVGSYFVWHDLGFISSVTMGFMMLFAIVYVLVYAVSRLAGLEGGLYNETGQSRSLYGSNICRGDTFSRSTIMNNNQKSDDGKEISCGLSVKFRPEVHTKMFTYARMVGHEISGFGKVRFLNPETILAEDALIHHQSNNPAHTDLNEGAGLFINELIERKEDPRLWRLWWHSHCNMGIGWSTEDDDTIDGFCVQNDASVCDWMLSIVLNKAGSMRIRFDLYRPLRITIDDIPWSLCTEPDSEMVKQCEKDIKTFVKRDVLGRLGYAVVLGGNRGEAPEDMQAGNGQKCRMGFCVKEGEYKAEMTEMTEEARKCFAEGSCPVCEGPAEDLHEQAKPEKARKPAAAGAGKGCAHGKE